jgi:hypothetical protein
MCRKLGFLNKKRGKLTEEKVGRGKERHGSPGQGTLTGMSALRRALACPRRQTDRERERVISITVSVRR